ncbi:phosphate ABC transporter substrate-binding/OmpA family protein [Pseudomonas sp. 5P_3.1_Bac2]|uniref:phosphate ABC transporter substrate-binding/OmpA family protein n=1 Tax=Pseudomonas sp. 5P_3.1_Bac2 TaxID=2971617 RepID=UPI0021C7548D|nr:substrate-binding domain-containing protein [Pseudomonas sp. 5P_3.1_Bac2]MCU1717128.1 substrate-binding domain-containing protein [Pseudomonas sp. 5P_3.1_Bac2]
MLHFASACERNPWPRLISWLLLASCCYALPLAARAASQDTDSARSDLRIEGSNTLGAELIPALLKGMLQQQGIRQIQLEPGAQANEQILLALGRDGRHLRFDIAAHGSSTGFTALAQGRADLAASSRLIKAAESQALAHLGDMRSAASEHIIGLDGLAIIVHPDNPLKALSSTQLAQVFAGQVRDWSELGGPQGSIVLYARDEQSGTFDSFNELLLKPNAVQLSATAKRFEDSSTLSAGVSQDRQAIGFIGLPYVRHSKPLAVSAPDAQAMLPSPSLIATEDYPLARRLYLYSPAPSNNPWLQQLVAFAHSDAGQAIVKQAGFVGQNIQAMTVEVQADMPSAYQQLAATALRLSVNFRFAEGSASLDNKAQQDLKRLLSYLQAEHKLSGKVVLVGFADSKSAAQRAELLSRLRAMAVRRELQRAGAQVQNMLGMGAAMPVASNTGDEGRVKNRRVEVWVYP